MDKIIYKNIFEMVGNTPLAYVNTDEVSGANIYIKLEGYNPTGSIKDRAGLYNIRGAIKSGELTKGMTILEASSGNMACAVAYYGKILGYKTHVVCGSKLTLDKRNFIEYFGAEVEMYGDYTIEANRHCRDSIAPSSNEYCFLDQLHNPNNPLASYETLGPELLRDLPELKMVVGSLGSGGSMAGAGRYLKEKNKNIKVITVEANSGSKIPGTGSFVDGDYITPFISKARELELFDDSISIDIDSAMQRSSQLAAQGYFVGFQTGGVFDACIKAINKYNIKGDVVIVSGDSGWKNVDKLMASIR
jgi:[CysO sulfur-carrier protein]-thiocarboxylate-dependent cysteine synthase